MSDPPSWLQIQQGWDVTTSDGSAIGTVAQVEGDKQDASSTAWRSRLSQVRCVPGEQVGLIYYGEVMLKFIPSETGRPISNWMRGKR